MSDKEKTKTIAEYEGNWIEYINDDGFEYYNLYLNDNMTMVSMLPEAFEKLKLLFKHLDNKNHSASYIR